MNKILSVSLSALALILCFASSLYSQSREEYRVTIVPKIEAIDNIINVAYDTLDFYGKKGVQKLPPDIQKEIKKDTSRILKTLAEIKKIKTARDTFLHMLVTAYTRVTTIYARSLADLALSDDINAYTLRSYNTIDFQHMELIKENLLEYLYEEHGGRIGTVLKQNDFYASLTFGFYSFIGPKIQDDLIFGNENLLDDYQYHTAYLLNLDYNASKRFLAGFSVNNIPEQGFTALFNGTTIEERISGTAVGFHLTARLISKANFQLTASLGLTESFFSEHSTISLGSTSQTISTHSLTTTAQTISNDSVFQEDNYESLYLIHILDTTTVTSTVTTVDTTSATSSSSKEYISHPSTVGVTGSLALAYYPGHSGHLSLNAGICVNANSGIAIRARNYGTGVIPEQKLPFTSLFISAGIGIHF